MIQEVGAVITGLQTSIGIISSALRAKADSTALGEVIKLQSQIAQIQEIAIKMQAEYMNLVTENERMKSWNEESVKYELAREYFYFYTKKSEYCGCDIEKEARYCSNCFHEMRLSILTPTGYNYSKFKCPCCKTDYFRLDKVEYDPPMEAYKP